MEWNISTEPVDYPTAVGFMERRVADILAGRAPEMVWLLEHPPLYTGGTSAKTGDLLDGRFPTYHTGRGGEWTYHGPGQRVAYIMLDLNKRGRDLRRYVQNLEQWIIGTLKHFGVEGFTRQGRVGVWVKDSGKWQVASGKKEGLPSLVTGHLPLATESKIAALGIRVRKWVSYHGISINVNPDLTHYRGIVPCGISGYGVTSLAQFGVDVSMAEIDKALKHEFEQAFV